MCHYKPGALLFFYKSKSPAHTSQAITAIGILENFSLATSTQELTRLAGGRSVYSENALNEFEATSARPVKVINFLLACYVDPVFSLEEMKAIGISLPQSISEIKPLTLNKVLEATKLSNQSC